MKEIIAKVFTAKIMSELTFDQKKIANQMIQDRFDEFGSEWFTEERVENILSAVKEYIA